MTPFKYAELAQLEDWRARLGRITASTRSNLDGKIVLDDAAKSARANLARVLDLAVLPKELFGLGCWYHVLVSNTIQRQGTEFNATDTVGTESPFNVDRMRRWMQSSNKIEHENAIKYREIGPDVGNFYRQAGDAMDERYTEGTYSVMAAMITGTWTAFEVLAGDAWTAAVDEKPLTYLKSTAKEGKIQLNLTVAQFQDNGYDMRGKIGTLAKDHEGVSFLKLRRIKDAYSSALDIKISAFDTHKDRSLFDLSQIRNTIVHGASQVNTSFLDTMVQILNPRTQFSGLTLQEKIPLDGPLIVELIDGAITASVELITAVDQWIAEAKG